MAAGRDPDITADASEGRPDKECIPYIRTTDSSGIRGYRMPNNTDSKRAG